MYAEVVFHNIVHNRSFNSFPLHSRVIFHALLPHFEPDALHIMQVSILMLQPRRWCSKCIAWDECFSWACTELRLILMSLLQLRTQQKLKEFLDRRFRSFIFWNMNVRFTSSCIFKAGAIINSLRNESIKPEVLTFVSAGDSIPQFGIPPHRRHIHHFPWIVILSCMPHKTVYTKRFGTRVWDHAVLCY